jgi:D-lactate dehydrogenase
MLGAFHRESNMNTQRVADLITDILDVIIRMDRRVFERLTTLPNVVITGHQAFLTREALTHIVETTLGNISDFQLGQQKSDNLVTAPANRPTKS